MLFIYPFLLCVAHITILWCKWCGWLTSLPEMPGRNDKIPFVFCQGITKLGPCISSEPPLLYPPLLLVSPQIPSHINKTQHKQSEPPGINLKHIIDQKYNAHKMVCFFQCLEIYTETGGGGVCSRTSKQYNSQPLNCTNLTH